MPAAFSAPKQNLQQLVFIRWALIAGLAAGLLVGRLWLKLPLIYPVLVGLVLGFVVLNLLTHLRLRKAWPVTTPEFFGQILFDIFGVTLLFYFSGGATNPFVSYYLVPITVSIVTLPWRLTWLTVLLSVCSYSLLLFFYLPIEELDPMAGAHVGHAMHGGDTSLINAHILGMWFNFVISAGFIAYFVVRMVNTLRAQQQQLNDYREENLRDEQVLAVATLAAGTAHELGSPLTTMKVVLKEMQHELAQQPENANSHLQEDITLLEKQVEVCSRTLKDLVSRAETSDTATNEKTIYDYCEKIIDRWQVLRPAVKADIDIQQQDKNRSVNFHTTIDQAIINLLNNSAEASKEKVLVTMRWDETTFTMTIQDDGPGIPDSVKSQIGQAFVTTKRRGLGLGLFLSNATISRYNGTLEIQDIPDGGTEIILKLPIIH